jgi:hypothetical protein
MAPAETVPGPMILARWNDMNLPTGTVTVPTGSSAMAASRERRAGCLEINGWTARRREVIERDSGVCALCGQQAADTASHSQEVGDLVAAHTRCVVGLGPPAISTRDAA